MTAGRIGIGVRAERGSTSLAIGGLHCSDVWCIEGVISETKMKQDPGMASSADPLVITLYSTALNQLQCILTKLKKTCRIRLPFSLMSTQAEVLR